MLAGLTSVFNRILPLIGVGNGPSAAEKAASKEAAESKRRKEVIKRQRKILANEINLTWRIAVGKDFPKKLKDTYVVSNMTRRNVWMEENFLFNQITALFPDERFHSVDKYILRWNPPKSNFQIVVPLTDRGLQENAILETAKLKSSDRKKIIFLFTTLDPTLPLFAEKVHPSSLVSYRTRVEVLKKLSDLFLIGKISVDEIQQIFICDFEIWRQALYNYLPEDEQVYHTYLMEKLKAPEEKVPAKKYLDGDITLKEYEEEIFPERSRRKKIEAMEYPLPLTTSPVCVICGEDGPDHIGVVQCHTCENMVCRPCIITVFHGDQPHLKEPAHAQRARMAIEKANDNREKPDQQQEAESVDKGNPEVKRQTNQRGESYLLMHHKYCMKLGELPVIQQEIVADDAYLRQFRSNSRLAVLKRFNPMGQIDYDDYSLLDTLDEDELEKRRLEQQKQRDQEQAVQEKNQRENPTELQQRRQQLEERQKKFDKAKKEIQSLDLKLADVSHTEAFKARNQRLRVEAVEKLEKHVQKPLLRLQEELMQMGLPGDCLPSLLREVNAILAEIETLTRT